MDFILEALGSVGFNWHVAVLNFFNFLIVLFILNKFFFAKIGKTITQRAALIKHGLKDAEEAGKSLRTAEEEKMRIVHDAKVEAKALIDAGVYKGEFLAKDIALKSQVEADALRDDLNSKIQNAKLEVENDFASLAPAHVANILEAVLKQNMSVELSEKFIKSQMSAIN